MVLPETFTSGFSNDAIGNAETMDGPTVEWMREQAARLDAAVTGSVQLRTDDGVFMPQHARPAVGAGPLRATYEGVFGTIRLDVVFDIAEVVPVADDWAFARTNSVGTVTVRATGQSGPEANQELFVLEKTNSGDWKIARYCFSTTNPPRG